MFNRDKVIETLVDDDFNCIDSDNCLLNDRSYFYELMTTGFKGYDNMTDEELMQECDERDISYLFGEDDDVQQLKDEKNGLYPDKWDIAN